MAKFCTNCGAPVGDEKFCTQCGAPIENDAPQTAQAPQYYPAAITLDSGKNKVSTWGFFGLLVLFSLPFIGFIAAIIMAIAPENETIKKFARGFIIYTLVITILGAILLVSFSTLMAHAVEDAMDNPEFSEYFSQFEQDIYDSPFTYSDYDEYSGLITPIA